MMSLRLAERLNNQPRRAGVFFMPFAKNHVDRIHVKAEEVLVVASKSEVADILDTQERMGAAVTAFVYPTIS